MLGTGAAGSCDDCCTPLWAERTEAGPDAAGLVGAAVVGSREESTWSNQHPRSKMKSLCSAKEGMDKEVVKEAVEFRPPHQQC